MPEKLGTAGPADMAVSPEDAGHKMLPDSDTRLRRTIAEAKRRTRSKRSVPAIKVQNVVSDRVRHIEIKPSHNDFAGWAHQMGDAFGSTSPAFVRHQMDRLLTTVAGKNDASSEDTVCSMLAMV